MEEQWRKVVFSYKSRFNVVGSNGREWCWVRHVEPLCNCMISKIVKHGGGNIMVWGYMGWEGIGELTKIEEATNSEH